MESDPKTRKQTKKSAKDKACGKDTCYSAKRIRQVEVLLEQRAAGKHTQHTQTHR